MEEGERVVEGEGEEGKRVVEGGEEGEGMMEVLGNGKREREGGVREGGEGEGKEKS